MPNTTPDSVVEGARRCLPGLVSLAFLLLSGCGGGGGGATSTEVSPPAPSPSTSCVAGSTVSSGLVISEVASNFGPSSGGWLEVYNASDSAIELSSYSLRSGSSNSSGAASANVQSFTLPKLTLAAGAYLVIAAKTDAAAMDGAGIVYVGGSNAFPYWDANGLVELVKDGATQDAVRFGSSAAQPTSACQWQGNNVAALPSSAADFGKSIVRPQAGIRSNTHTAADWVQVDFSTPGGPNDVPAGAVDADKDGIPDSAERAGATFAGLDLYALGARAGTPDIFVQLDHMAATTNPIYLGNQAWTPQRGALDMVVAAFAKRGYAVHFDAGDAFGDAPGTGYNLGGGKQVAFAECLGLDTSQSKTGCASVYTYKRASMAAARRPIFHYMLMGNQQEGTTSAGLAELDGNDAIITLGWDYQIGNAQTVNYQAATIMHELGHNLGLRHGGDEDRNFKPNYYSVMNYLYALYGLAADPKGEGGIQRWYMVKDLHNIGPADLINSPLFDDFHIDFSDGSGTALDMMSLQESALIGRGANAGVYADWNGSSGLDLSTYALTSLNTVAADPGWTDRQPRVPLHDYNDWANLKLTFSRNAVGSNTVQAVRPKTGTAPSSMDAISNDRQAIAAEWAPPHATR